MLHPQAARPFASSIEGKMSYEDFVWFILSEEDKTSDVSLDYWFRCVDLDCDGALQPNEMLVRERRSSVKATSEPFLRPRRGDCNARTPVLLGCCAHPGLHRHPAANDSATRCTHA